MKKDDIKLFQLGKTYRSNFNTTYRVEAIQRLDKDPFTFAVHLIQTSFSMIHIKYDEIFQTCRYLESSVPQEVIYMPHGEVLWASNLVDNKEYSKEDAILDHDIQVKLFETNQVYRTAHGKYVKVLEVNRKVEPVCVKVEFINTMMQSITNPSEMYATLIIENYMQYETILLPVDDSVSFLDKVGLDVTEQTDNGIYLPNLCEDDYEEYRYEEEMYDNIEYDDLVDQLIRDYHRYKSKINYIEHLAKKFAICLED